MITIIHLFAVAVALAVETKKAKLIMWLKEVERRETSFLLFLLLEIKLEPGYWFNSPEI